MRKLLPLLFAVPLLAVASGFAAALAVDSNPVGAGQAAVGACGVGSATATYPTNAEGQVTQVIVATLAAACNGGTIKAQLMSGGVAVTGASGSAPVADGTATITLATPYTVSGAPTATFVITGPTP